MSDEQATHIDDEFHGVGGSYRMVDGKRVRAEEPTAPAPVAPATVTETPTARRNSRTPTAQ